MASIITIQPTDLISNSRADINTNFANLNTDKAESSVVSADFLSKPVDASTLATLGTPDNTTFLRGDMRWATPPTGPTARTVIPNSPLFFEPGSATPDVAINIVDNATMYLGQVVVPFAITVNKLSVNVVGTNDPGQFRMTLYEESGASSVFTASTFTLVHNPASTLGIVTTILPSVLLSAGNYYMGINGISSVSLAISAWDTDAGVAINRFRSSVAGSPIIEGAVSIIASTPPSSITTRAIPELQNSTLMFRLDN